MYCSNHPRRVVLCSLQNIELWKKKGNRTPCLSLEVEVELYKISSMYGPLILLLQQQCELTHSQVSLHGHELDRIALLFDRDSR
jgi:hypothetical protein